MLAIQYRTVQVLALHYHVLCLISFQHLNSCCSSVSTFFLVLEWFKRRARSACKSGQQNTEHQAIRRRIVTTSTISRRMTHVTSISRKCSTKCIDNLNFCLQQAHQKACPIRFGTNFVNDKLSEDLRKFHHTLLANG